MHAHNGTLYPMLGVGAFMTMFWTGIVVGHELGLGCASLLIMGLLSGFVATVGVCELQRRDGFGLPAEARGRVPQPNRPRDRRGQRQPHEGNRSGLATVAGARLSAGPAVAL
jgi:hypothetical protein